MAFEVRRVGAFRVTAIMDVEGRLSFDDTFGDMPPPTSLDQLAIRFPADYTATSWRFRCRCFLVEDQGPPILIDLGAGPAGSMFNRGTGFIGTFDAALVDLGVSASDVRDVVMTHAHGDHTGWSCISRDDAFEPMFPNARYHLHAADVAQVREAQTEDDRRWWEETFAPLESAGLLVATDEDGPIVTGLRVEHTPGHTPGHRVAVVESGVEAMVIAGDLLHFTHQLDDAVWPSPHDEDPALAIATRLAVLDRVEATGATLATAHLPYAFATLGRMDERRTLLDASDRR